MLNGGTTSWEVAARHPSLRRYLGDKASGFVGQDAKHFRLLLAEIVAESVCQKLVSQLTNDNPEDYEDADWDLYYAEYSRLMTEFLPIAPHTTGARYLGLIYFTSAGQAVRLGNRSGDRAKAACRA